MLILFVVSVSLPAAGEGKRKIVFAGIGAAASDLEGFYLILVLKNDSSGIFTVNSCLITISIHSSYPAI
jgi:hypothetical protein